MRVLVACEFSGVVREAFRKRGHDAWSCDLLPTEIEGKHIINDVKSGLKISKKKDGKLYNSLCLFLVIMLKKYVLKIQ